MIGYIIDGNEKEAKNKERELKETIERFGAIAMTNACQVGGIAVNAVVGGIPNPAAGALNGVAQKGNAVIDKNVKENHNGVNWG